MVIPDKPLGGTELMYNELMSRLDPKILERYSIFNYISNADFNKKLSIGTSYLTIKTLYNF